ncbi:MAG: hypothetical protein ACKO43_01310 [Alphaproteobacteria bacterium]
MIQDTTTSREETHAQPEKKPTDQTETTPESAPREWIVRKSDGRMVVTDF